MNRSSFTSTKGYIIDTFPELANLPPSMIQDAERLSQLRAKPNKTELENQEVIELMEKLKNYEVSPETWNKLCDAIVNMETFIKDNVEGYIQQKQEEFQAEIDKFRDFGDYNPTTRYYKNNIVHYKENMEKYCYLCKGNIDPITGIDEGVIGINPSDKTKWLQLMIKGDKGEKGGDGVGLVSKGIWSNTNIYNLDNLVFHKGYSFASLKNGNIGQEPVPNMDTEWWGMVFKNTVVGTTLEGMISITANSKNIRFMGLGNINVYNPNTDTLNVILNSVPLKRGIHYDLNPDNQSITCLTGDFIASVSEPAFFTFKVGRNQINDLVLSDGNGIQNGTVGRLKLELGVQNQLDKIDILSTDIGDKSLVNTGFKDNLVGAINEINEKVGDLATLPTMDKTSVVGSIKEVNSKVNNLKLVDTKISITDATNKFTATTLDGVLDELFTNANNGKTLISNVVGSPLLASDTFQQQVDKIQVLKTNMATNLTAKGVNAVGTETLSGLASKISNITLGKKWASGTILSDSTSTSIYKADGVGLTTPYINYNMSQLNFIPSYILITDTSKNTPEVTIWFKENYYNNTSFGQYCNSIYWNNIFRSPYIQGTVKIPVKYSSMNYNWIAIE